jgi:hypothetical protein
MTTAPVLARVPARRTAPAAQPLPQPPPASPPARRLRPTLRTVRYVVLAITVLAAGVRLYRLAFGYGHAVVGYDDGVYLGSALEFVHGQLPYSDVVFVQPPMITWLLTPVALLAKVIGTAQAMGLAKIATGLAGAAAVPLTARLVQHRGLVPTVLACAFVAVQGDAVASAYTLLLEPWLVLLTLLGLVLIFDAGRLRDGRALWWGGIVLGLACATKIWAFVPVLVLVAVLWPDRTRLRRYAAGVGVGFAVPVLPFALLAPGAFVHEVVVDQLLRGTGSRTGAPFRLLHLFGPGVPNGALPTSARAALIAVAVVVAAVLGALCVRLVCAADPLERFAALAAPAVVAMLFVPSTFYWHYAAFAVPFLALVAALGPRAMPRFGRRAAVTVLCLALIGLCVALAHRDARGYHLHDEARAFDAAVPAGSCVVASMSSTTIADDRFAAGARSAHCPALLDPLGVLIAHGGTPAALRSQAVQAQWLAAYRQADFVYLIARDTVTVPTAGPAQRYLRAHFRVLPVAGLQGVLYRRTGGR